MEKKKVPFLTEELVREHEKLIKLIMEEQRYKQNARLRALEIAQLEIARTGGDVLTEAQKYYDWLMETATHLAEAEKDAS